MPSSFQSLGIRSEHEAAELERDLSIRFSDFTPEERDTWILQSIYLETFSKTRVISFAADEAGISIATARQWQTDNTLGFNQRLEIAVLRYTDMLEVMLLQRAQQPDSPPSLLMMLLRAHMPEKYGSARRGSAPRDDNNARSHDHDPQPPTTSKYDRELLEAIFPDLQNLKQFTGLSEPDPTPVGAPMHDPAPSEQAPVGPGFRPAPDLSPTEEENTPHSNLSPDGGETQRGGAPAEQAPVGPGFRPAPDLSSTGEENTPHSNLSPDGGEAQRGGAPADQSPVVAGFKPAPPPQQPSPNTQNLTRRQRRALQRNSKRKPQIPHHQARAPT